MWDQFFDGYCPESKLHGEKVKMRLNTHDFFESEKTGLQIAISYPGVHAVVLKFRGKGEFRNTIKYAHDSENGELLSPQLVDSFPYCGNKVFESENEIMSYLNNDVEFIKKPYPKIMKSTLTHADFEKFWHRLYFDINEGFISAAIKRAYRDFNRTIKGMPKEENERHPLRENWVEFLKSSFEVFLKKEFLSQQEFDLWHRDMCEKLENINKDKKVILNVGQAQKWINMTLKYLFLIGENYVEGISKNYKFFHIPLDSIIQTAMNNKYGIQPIPGAWSQITDYDKYLQYQNAIRTKFPNTIPMDEEFKLFNLSYSGSSNNVIPL